MSESSRAKRRRRGVDLEHAILGDTWAELVEHGYAGLTMEGAASRAGTSRSVLARRWPDRFSLAIAAIRHHEAQHPLSVADSGDLRTELLEYLNRASKRVLVVAVVFSLLANEHSPGTTRSLQQLHALLAGGEERVIAAILQRAVERGEVDSKKLVPAVETLLADLFRYHAIMKSSAPSPALRKTWVDAIFLPIVRAT
jgi:AcrR family transcriptional regulator